MNAVAAITQHVVTTHKRVQPATRAAAARLLTDLVQVFETHDIDDALTRMVCDLPEIALAAVMAHEKRMVIRGWPTGSPQHPRVIPMLPRVPAADARPRGLPSAGEKP